MRDALIKPINDGATKPVEQKGTVLITGFCAQSYLPHISGEGGLKTSTVWGYKQVFNQHLRPHFKGKTLRNYRTHMGSQLLTELAKKLGPEDQMMEVS